MLKCLSIILVCVCVSGGGCVGEWVSICHSLSSVIILVLVFCPTCFVSLVGSNPFSVPERMCSRSIQLLSATGSQPASMQSPSLSSTMLIGMPTASSVWEAPRWASRPFFINVGPGSLPGVCKCIFLLHCLWIDWWRFSSKIYIN